MFRVYVILAVLLLTNLVTGVVAYKLASAKYINLENKAIIAEVEKYNDNLERLEASTKKLEAIKAGVRTEIHHLPGIDTSKPCPIDDVVRLRNEAYRSLPEVYFQSTNPLPKAD